MSNRTVIARSVSDEAIQSGTTETLDCSVAALAMTGAGSNIADESVTMELLIEEDTQAEMNNKRLWASVSRKSFPKSDAEGPNT